MPLIQNTVAAEQARLSRDPSFQFDFQTISPPKPPSWVKWLEPIVKFVAPVTPYLFWAGLIVIVTLLVFLVCRELWRMRGTALSPAKVLESSGLAPSRSHVRALLEEADRLAADGRYGEAARVLLHRTLDDLSDREPGLISPAQTAREIASLNTLPPPIREPLARIAAAVEHFLFAGQAITRDAFETCREDYDRFLAAAGRQ